MEQILSPIKEEYSCEGSSSSSAASLLPRPMEGLNETGPPAFLTKTYDLVDDFRTDGIISWSRGGQSFVVWDTHAFSSSLLPNFFKHNNFSSFIRQLNTYGFRKIDPDKCEFANESFLKGQKQLLKNIKRKKSTTIPPSENQQLAGVCELGGEIEGLRLEKQALSLEILNLRQEQQNTRACVQEMEMRLIGMEKRQQQMMGFLAKAMQNPDFIQQLVSRRGEIGLAESSKRRRVRPIEGGDELEALALEMQGFGKKRVYEEYDEIGWMGNYEKDLDDGFWEELLSEEFDKMDGEDDDEDVDSLVGRLGFLGSNPG